MHQLPATDRAERFAAAPARASGHAGVTLVAVLGVVDAAAAGDFLEALPVQAAAGGPPRVIVLAGAEDGCAADLVRLGADGWVHRDEPIEVLIDTIRAVLRGDVRVPQPLFDELLERPNRPTPNRPTPKRPRVPPAEALLTPREFEVLRLLELGISRAEIAGRLHVSPNTVRSHVQHILNRLGVHSTLAAVARLRSERAGVSSPAASGLKDLGRRTPLNAMH